MNNKRAKKRLNISEKIIVKDTVANIVLGTIANLHDEGFMLIGCEECVSEDAVYQLSFNQAADDEVVGEHVLDLGAECLWISDTGTGDQIWAGFQIIDLSEKGQEKLNQLIVQFSGE